MEDSDVMQQCHLVKVGGRRWPHLGRMHSTLAAVASPPSAFHHRRIRSSIAPPGRLKPVDSSPPDLPSFADDVSLFPPQILLRSRCKYEVILLVRATFCFVFSAFSHLCSSTPAHITWASSLCLRDPAQLYSFCCP